MNMNMGGAQPQPAGNQQGMIKQKLLELLQQASQVAEKNGLDFKQIIAEFMGGRMSGGSSPKPPMPPPGASMMMG